MIQIWRRDDEVDREAAAGLTVRKVFIIVGSVSVTAVKDPVAKTAKCRSSIVKNFTLSRDSAASRFSVVDGSAND